MCEEMYALRRKRREMHDGLFISKSRLGNNLGKGKEDCSWFKKVFCIMRVRKIGRKTEESYYRKHLASNFAYTRRLTAYFSLFLRKLCVAK